jgi:flagella basal body P-ring formation protein FlgA
MRRSAVNCLTLACILGGAMTSVAGTDSVQPLDSIRATAVEFVRNGSGADRARIRIETGTLDERLRLPACARPLEAFLPPGARLAGTTTIGVRCTAATSWSVFVPVRIKIHGPVLIAARPLARGVAITAADLRVENRDLAALPGAILADPAQAIGRQTAVPISAGSLLTPAQIRPARLVKRGEKVTILASSGAFEVRAGGEALADGAEGEAIPVRNVLTRKVVQATVTEAGVVRVRL